MANIPRPPVVGFVSRRDERGRDIVGLLRQELAPDKSQLVALWGPGGSGKTTLAAEFVRAAADSFRGGVAWVSALGRADFGLATLLDETATRLGREDLRKLAPETKAAAVAALVSGAPTLLVLDNFETISEEEQARCLDFLAQAAACPALITTRSRVNRDDVYNVPLAAMASDEARDFLGRLVERTREPANFDRLDRDDLIRRCEANPLILQWVVRQIDLAQRPQDVLDDLARGEGDAAERVFTRSFNLPQLGDDGRAALLALSLFTPDASREALAEVSGFEDDLRRLSRAVESLSSLWLIEATEGNERLFLRGLTRELSKSRLTKDARADEFMWRYVSHFLKYAGSHRRPTPEDLDALEAEKDNLFGAMNTALAVRDSDGLKLLRGTLDYFLYLRGHWDEALRTAELAGAAARDTGDESGVAYFGLCLAEVCMGRGEYAKARATLQESLEKFRGLKDERNAAGCLHNLAMIAQARGDLDEAWRLYMESLDTHRRLGIRRGVASSLHELGRLAQARRRFDEALLLYDESLEISRSLDDQRVIAGTTSQIGIMLAAQGKLEEAKARHAESLAIRRRLGELRGIAVDLHQLGLIAWIEDRLQEARRLYTESLEIHQRLGDQEGVASTLGDLGLLAEEEGDKAEAARLLRESLSIFERLGSPHAEKARMHLARMEGRFDGAV